MDRATNWDEIPLTLSVTELQQYFSFSRPLSYTLANMIGIKVGKRLVVPKARLRAWLETSFVEALGHSERTMIS